MRWFSFRSYLFICFFFSSVFSLGQGVQKQTSVWYITAGVGIKFPGPTLVKESQSTVYEASTTMADKDGNVLFYSNGQGVWDASNAIMPNGRGIDISGSSAQGILATNVPGSDTKYYLFSNTAIDGGQKGFRYSVVDMSLQGNGTAAQPLGDIAEKGKTIADNASEKVAATVHNNCKDIWVISHGANNNQFNVFLVTEDGIEKKGQYNLGSTFGGDGNRGYMAISPDGTKLAITSHAVQSFIIGEVYNFDNVTGEITGPFATISGKENNRPDGYGAAFSPNSEVLYITHHSTNYIEQYDLKAANVQGSRFEMNPGGSGGMATGIKLGQDGKIYISRPSTQFLSVIENPNNLKAAANYKEKGFNVEGSLVFGLPQMYVADETILIDSIVKIDIGCDGNTGEIQIYVNGAGPFKYSIDGGKNLQDSHIFKNLKKGKYDIYVENSNGCYARDTISILEKEKIEVKIEGPVGPFCIFEPTKVILEATPDGGVWSGNGVDPETGEFDPEKAGEGEHTIKYSIEDGCDGEATIKINVYGKVEASIDPVDNLCAGEGIIQLTGNPTGGFFSGHNVTKDGKFDPKDLEPGNYTVSYIIDLGACSDSTSTEITIVPTPQIEISADSVAGCSPLTVKFSYSSDIEIVKCSWDFGNGEVSNTCEDSESVYLEAKCYDVSLTSESKDGCNSTFTKEELVCVHPDPIANFDYSPNPPKIDNPKVHFTNKSQNADSYIWKFGELGTSIEIHPFFEFPGEEGIHSTCLTAISEYGCKDSICIPVEVIEEYSIYVPNAFSPNGDGLNDEFFPFLKGHDKDFFKMWIFNRWGELIYSTTDIDKTWNGMTRNGKNVQKQEVYLWKIKSRDRFYKKEHHHIGHVTLLK